jgi:hypothetical protein
MGILRDDQNHILVCGLTDGQVLLWDIGDCVSSFSVSPRPSPFRVDVTSSPLCLHTVHLHRMGVNCLSIEHIRNEPSEGLGLPSSLPSKTNVNDFLIVTGGDDESIGVILVRLLPGVSNLRDSLSITSKHFPSMSRSTIKGIAIQRGKVFVSGYDQRLDTWRISLEDDITLTLLTSTLLPVSVVESLHVASLGNKDAVVVGGGGLYGMTHP